MTIRKMTSEDWPAVSHIYAEGIATGIATFEVQVPGYKEWDRAHLDICRFVATENESVQGWAALSPVSGRCVYGGVAEISIYIAAASRGQGIGKQLMEQLIKASEDAGFWSLQAGIFPENDGSIALHKNMGFRYLGFREKIGKRDGAWKDNLLFERRSKHIGMDEPEQLNHP